MNVAAYLDRIGYTGALTVSPGTLYELHRLHVETVPFENLDVWRGRKITLDPQAFFHKIVEERRGGFCYELNGAFAGLLTEVGFRVTMLAAQVARDDGTYGREFAHLALRVDLERGWLVDVGFGDSFVEPLLLETEVEQERGGECFRLIGDCQAMTLGKRIGASEWKPQYKFTHAPVMLSDFEEMCHYQQTSPESHFVGRRICSRANTNGRITLADLTLIVTEGRLRREQLLASEYHWNDALREHFGILL